MKTVLRMTVDIDFPIADVDIFLDDKAFVEEIIDELEEVFPYITLRRYSRRAFIT